MPTLRITLDPNPRETLPSYLSRLAAANGLDAVMFSKDMGFSFKRVLNFEQSALEKLMDVSGISSEILDELISWSGKPAGDIRMQFRGELVPSRALRSPMVRGCPICLLADLKSEQDTPLKTLTYRGDWQLKDIKVCIEHDVPLVPLWEESSPSKRWNFQARFSDLLGGSILSQSSQSCCHVTGYDHWLHQRLLTGKDDTWLQAHTIFAASRLCLHIGQQIISHDIPGPFRTTGGKRPEAVGFDALMAGSSRLAELLNAMITAAPDAGHGPQKAFGALYPMLNRDYADAKEFDAFRNVMRSCILEQLAPCVRGRCSRATC